MESKKIFRCKHCGNIICKIHDSGVKVVCCGEEMEELIANTTDAAIEKHVPVVNRSGHAINVNVGEINHPMEEAHRIMWIYMDTKMGGQLKYLNVNDLPSVSFTLVDDEPTVVYAYCNLHGLWKSEIK